MLQRSKETTINESSMIGSMSKCGMDWRLFLGLCIYFFLSSVGFAYGANLGLSLETADVRIASSGCREYFDEWSVNILTPHDNDGWFSLVSRDSMGIAISRHLSFAGQDTGTSVWSKTDDQCLAYESTALNGRLSVRGRLCDSEKPYRLFLEIIFENISSEILPDTDLELTLGPGLGEVPVEGLGIAENLYSYVEPVFSINNEVESVPLQPDNGKQKQNLANQTLNWAGLHSRYFALLLVPTNPSGIKTIEYGLSGEPQGSHLPLRFLPQVSLHLDIDGMKPREIRKNQFVVFSGPKIISALKSGQNDLSDLLFTGQWQWMRMLCFGLLWILDAIHRFIPNWGLSIILLSVLVRALIYPLAKKMMEGQQAYAKVQKIIHPEIQAIKKRYKGEEQSERILAVYKKYKVSPFTGMKPLIIVLIQLPIFIALFQVLGQAFELRDGPFLWIDTLALPDRLFSFGKNLPFVGSYFNLLPFLMALSTLLTIKLSPSPGQSTIFLIIMAAGFLVLFYPFPSGMVLYWTVANTLQIIQQMGIKKWSQISS